MIYTHALYVANPNGWEIDCPTTLGIFWGDADNAIHPANIDHDLIRGASYGIAVYESFDAAKKALAEFCVSGDWNVDGEETRPTYRLMALTPTQSAHVAELLEEAFSA